MNFKHGFTTGRIQNPTYIVWRDMIRRCKNPKVNNYHRYGGRGILVCERWHEFTNFLTDMGLRPNPTFQLDRIDNDGNYEPSNCRWVERKVQARNCSDNRILELNGKKATLAEWAESTGLKSSTIRARLDRLKWPVERAISEPILCRVC